MAVRKAVIQPFSFSFSFSFKPIPLAMFGLVSNFEVMFAINLEEASMNLQVPSWLLVVAGRMTSNIIKHVRVPTKREWVKTKIKKSFVPSKLESGKLCVVRRLLVCPTRKLQQVTEMKSND